jgi:hypothetical protein
MVEVEEGDQIRVEWRIVEEDDQIDQIRARWLSVEEDRLISAQILLRSLQEFGSRRDENDPQW